MDFLRCLIRAARLRLRIRFGARCIAIHDLGTGYGIQCQRMRSNALHMCEEHGLEALMGYVVPTHAATYEETPLEDFVF